MEFCNSKVFILSRRCGEQICADTAAFLCSSLILSPGHGLRFDWQLYWKSCLALRTRYLGVNGDVDIRRDEVETSGSISLSARKAISIRLSGVIHIERLVAATIAVVPV